MNHTPSPQYILVRIPKKDQTERKEKIGSIYIPNDYVYMTRGIQSGEIVSIGMEAGAYFPEAKVGDVLLFNHMIEGKADDRRNKVYFIEEDEGYNYYIVPVCAEGEDNLSYGLWNGEVIIPNKDYIFINEIDSEEEVLNFELPQLGKTNIGFVMSEGGIAVPKERKKTRDQITEEMKKNTQRIKELSRHMEPRDVQDEMKYLEMQNNILSRQINKRCYELFKVEACNPILSRTVSRTVQAGSQIYVLNIAALTKVEFMQKEYIVAKSKYIGAVQMPFINDK